MINRQNSLMPFFSTDIESYKIKELVEITTLLIDTCHGLKGVEYDNHEIDYSSCDDDDRPYTNESEVFLEYNCPILKNIAHFDLLKEISSSWRLVYDGGPQGGVSVEKIGFAFSHLYSQHIHTEISLTFRLNDRFAMNKGCHLGSVDAGEFRPFILNIPISVTDSDTLEIRIKDNISIEKEDESVIYNESNYTRIKEPHIVSLEQGGRLVIIRMSTCRRKKDLANMLDLMDYVLDELY